jgi:hypothetical protein
MSDCSTEKMTIVRLVVAWLTERLPGGFLAKEPWMPCITTPSKVSNLEPPYPPIFLKMLQNALSGSS